MKTLFLCLLALLSNAIALIADQADPEFFVFDNGVARGLWSSEKQAATLEQVGCKGISCNFTTTNALADWLRVYPKHGVKLYAIYVYTYVDRPEHYDPAFKQAIQMLKGTDAVIWMTLCKPKAAGDFDAEAVRNVREIADQAAENGLRVAVYGHFGFYVGCADDAVRIVKKVNRPNVGATFNLCHEFFMGKGDRLEQSLRNAAPCLSLVSICGVDVKEKKWIMRLDQGDFDVTGFVKQLVAAGYKGPVGLQCYQVPGDVTENLEADMIAWRKIVKQLNAKSAQIQ